MPKRTGWIEPVSLPHIDASAIVLVRRGLGLSQRGLAAQLGVATSTVARWEQGQTVIESRTLALALEALSQRLRAKPIDPAPAVVAPNGLNEQEIATMRALGVRMDG